MGVTPSARALIASALAMTIATMPTLAFADDASRRADQALALGCHTCHSPAVRGPGAISALRESSADMLRTLLAFKRDQRPATIMDRIAKGYADDELARIAAFITDEVAAASKVP